MQRIRIAVSVLVVGLAFSGLLWVTFQEGTEYYKHVDEVMTSSWRWEGKPLQLHGFVVPGSISVRPYTLEYRFQIQNRDSFVGVAYTGVLPDTFRDGAEVVLKGRLNNQVFLVSKNGVMAKCPSKYQVE